MPNVQQTPVEVLRAIVERGQAAYIESLPDFARDFGAEPEATTPNITLTEAQQVMLCLSCPLSECADITSPRCPIRIEQRRLWREQRRPAL